MAETVEQMAADIVRREGGYVDKAADRGGPTNYGITLAVAEAHGYSDVQQITPEVAQEIMIHDYLKAPGLDRLPVELQPQLFDIAVNSGCRESVLLLQHALVSLGAMDAGDVDGKLGDGTAGAAQAAVQAQGWQAVEDAIVTARVAFYRALVARNPAEEEFLKGWDNRAESFEVPVPAAG